MKKYLQKYKHGWVFSYMILYLIWFFYLENRDNIIMKTIHISLDDWIPFNEWFIIPYLFWFIYMAGVVMYYFFTSKKDFYKCTAFLFIGMSICLFIYTIWPNGQNLRPAQFANNNIATALVQYIYSVDTATNVCPSIHVYNTIGIHIAIAQNPNLRNNKLIYYGSLFTAIMICLSTVFLKQHSAFDGICAILLSWVMYLVVYKINYSQLLARYRAKKDESISADNI